MPSWLERYVPHPDPLDAAVVAAMLAEAD